MWKHSWIWSPCSSSRARFWTHVLPTKKDCNHMSSGPSFFIQLSLSHLKQLSHPEMAEDLRRRVESTRQGFEVRRLHKHFPARFWWRGKNRTKYGLWKFSHAHLTSSGESFLKYFGEKNLYINSSDKPYVKIWGCGMIWGVKELVAQGQRSCDVVLLSNPLIWKEQQNILFTL